MTKSVAAHGASKARQPAGSRVQDVLTAVGRRIVAGRYPPGSALPTEADIGREFGVGRNAVREVSKTLVGKQLVRTGRRAGTLVRPRNEWNLFDSDVVAWRLHDEVERAALIGEMSQLRRLLEPEVAASAALNARTTQIVKIFEAYEKMEEAGDGPEAAVCADMDYHNRVFEATNNPLLISISGLLSLRLTINLELIGKTGMTEKLMENHRKSLQSHFDMAEAILARDPDRARSVCQQMFVDVYGPAVGGGDGQKTRGASRTSAAAE